MGVGVDVAAAVAADVAVWARVELAERMVATRLSGADMVWVDGWMVCLAVGATSGPCALFGVTMEVERSERVRN